MRVSRLIVNGYGPDGEGIAPEGTKVVEGEEDTRGYATVATRDFEKGEVIFSEGPIAVADPEKEPAWVTSLRAALAPLSADCAWQFCMAVRCLGAAELPAPRPPDMTPLPEDLRAKMLELCGSCVDDGLEPSELGSLTARHLLDAADRCAEGGQCQWPAASGVGDGDCDGVREMQRVRVARWLGDRLDDIAHRISRNGFQLIRPTADGLFHRISYMNHCCAGLNNAAWSWNGAKNLQTVRTTREVLKGEELTISYIAKPWCDMATRARRRYLKNNYNFVCLCKACCQPPAARREAAAEAKAKAVPPSSEGAVTKAAADKKSKLASLLVRWLQDEDEVPPDSQGDEKKDVDPQKEIIDKPEEKQEPEAVNAKETIEKPEQIKEPEAVNATAKAAPIKATRTGKEVQKQRGAPAAGRQPLEDRAEGQ